MCCKTAKNYVLPGLTLFMTVSLTMVEGNVNFLKEVGFVACMSCSKSTLGLQCERLLPKADFMAMLPFLCQVSLR